MKLYLPAPDICEDARSGVCPKIRGLGLRDITAPVSLVGVIADFGFVRLVLNRSDYVPSHVAYRLGYAYILEKRKRLRCNQKQDGPGGWREGPSI